jgi:hypothetical protein
MAAVEGQKVSGTEIKEKAEKAYVFPNASSLPAAVKPKEEFDNIKQEDAELKAVSTEAEQPKVVTPSVKRRPRAELNKEVTEIFSDLGGNTAEKKRAFSYFLSPSTDAAFERIAKEKGVSKSQVVEYLANKLLK